MHTTEELLHLMQTLTVHPDGRVNAHRGKLRNLDPDGLNPRERVFVNTYCETLNANKAGEAAGYCALYGRRLITVDESRHVQHAIARELQRRTNVSVLNGEYVREYIKGIMELCPTDFFYLGEDGDWYIDPAEFRKLPQEVKRYVEGVELRMTRSGPRIKVNFVSKTAALAMAARYTLTAKEELKLNFPWQEIIESGVTDGEQAMKLLEAQIEGAEGVQRSVETGEAPLA